VDPESGRRIRYKRVVDLDDAPEERGAPVGDEDPGAVPPRTAPDEREEEHDEVEAEVPYEALARGYEVAPGEHVTLTQDEIRSVRPTKSRTIEIEDFVDLASIDPVYFEKSYLVAPGSGGLVDRPYALLLEALERSSRVGIGRFVLRTKPHLVAVRSHRGALGLETLLFGDEVREPSRIVSTESIAMGDRELAMAEQLIGMLARDWDPARYSDTYREDLLRLIAEKTPEPAPIPSAPSVGASPSDVERLMDALKESVAQAKRKRRGPPREARGA
jgi:DNA end-binding protein Ku